jgi:succinyl-CoA synthetase beta subunit
VRLFEYQAKEILKSYGISVPRSVVVSDPGEIAAALDGLSLPVVLKAQVLAGGRGKAGGVKVVSDEDEALKEAGRIFGLSIGGEKPASILVEESFSHEKEMYLSVTLDRGERAFEVVATTAGGIEVESVSDKVIRKIPLDGIDQKFADEVADLLGLPGVQASQFSDILVRLEKLAREKECELAEINPLAADKTGKLLSLDAKVIVDDNALFRHPEFSKLVPEDEFEAEASKQGFAFVRLGGDIAVVGNGAGLVLSTLDLVGDAGGRPACFLDLGGGAQQERIEAALRLVNKLPEADRVLANIFGGITRTTDVAHGILAVLGEGNVKPIFARVSGAEEDEAKKMLASTPVKLFGTAPAAVNAVVSSP